jgi:hypothetical protein
MRNYMDEYEGNREAAVLAMAADLMRGDAATMKVGYTLANALIAADEVVPDTGAFTLGEIADGAHRAASSSARSHLGMGI